MEFAIPEESRMIKQAVRRFIEENLYPIEMQVPEGVWLPAEHGEPLKEKSKALGLWALGAPVEYGGGGLGCLADAMVQEEFGRTTVGVSEGGVFGFHGVGALYAGTEEQIRRWLLPTIRGEVRCFFGMTEPGTGADPASMRTTARREGDYYIINGGKTFISEVDRSPFGVLLCKTQAERGRAGISAIVVETKTPGFKIVRQIHTIVGEARRSFEIAFDDMKVPVENRLGEEGEGFTLGQKHLSHARMMFGPHAVGMGERLIPMCAGWAKQRVTFGQPIAARQAIQWMLADSFIDILSLRWMSFYTAWKMDRGEESRSEQAAIKSYAADVGFRVADRAMQVYGAIGTSDDLPVSRYWRRWRHARIGEGSQEVMKFTIARNLLRD